MKQLIAFAKIQSGIRTWEEDFKVDSKKTAEAEVKEVIQYFNNTLKPGERPRSFEGIVRFEEKEIIERDISEDDDYLWDEDHDDYDDDY